MIRNRVLALMVVLGMASVPAMADTFNYNFTSDHCSGGGGCSLNGTLNPMGTITVTDIGTNEVSVAVTLDPGFLFVVTGAGTGNSGNASFYFDTTSGSTITITNLSSGWSIPNVTAGDQQAAGQYAGDGLMNDYNHGLTCSSCGSGGGGGIPGPLDFDVTLAGLTAANFVTTPFFAADVLSSDGNTGLIDGSPATTRLVPEPSTVLLLGTGMLGLGVAMRRKVQQ